MYAFAPSCAEKTLQPSIIQPFFQPRPVPSFLGNTHGFNPVLSQHGGEGDKPAPESPSPKTKPTPATSSPKTIVECDPPRLLNWADYTGTVPRGATWAAMTASGYRLVNNNSMIQAYFKGSRSWALDKYKYPNDNNKNGCLQHIDNCKRGLRGQTGKKASFNNPTNTCPATSAPPSNSASNVAECDSILGKACTQFAVNESRRLLRHEQLHYQITCTLVKKANIALNSGVDLGKISNSLASEYATCQGNYDTETNHGCNPAKQAKWETAVAKGLPAVSIP